MKFISVRSAGILATLAVLFVVPARMSAQFGWSAPPPESAASIPSAQILQPEELNRLLHSPGANKPLILQVGSHMLFAQAHIAGSEYAGPGSQPEALNQLQARVAPLARKTFIVLYCGCCPWSRCPNVGPAFKLLRDLGFTNVKVLYLANNLGADWVDKGYPIERGR
jgi:rhodanese-related sulfurtransferase